MATFARRPQRIYREVVYGGGACALRTLERRLGRARFDALLRTVIRDHRDGVMTTAAFVAAVDAAALAGVEAARLLRRVRLTAR